MTAPVTAPVTAPPSPWDVVGRQVLAMREQLEAVLLFIEAQRHAPPAAAVPPGMADLVARLSRRQEPAIPATFGHRPDERPTPQSPEPSDRSPDDGPQAE